MDDIKAWLNSGQDYHTGCALIIRHHPNKALHQVFREEATPYKVQRLKRELLALLATGKRQPANGKQPTAVATVMPAPCPHKHGADYAHLCTTCNPQPQTPNAKPQTAANRWGPPEQMPPVVHALWTEWKPLYAERNNIMARLYDVANAGQTDEGQKQEAGRMAHRILDLDERIESIYEKRQQYITTGALPVDEKAPDDLVVDPKKIPLALQNAKRYVREFARKLKTAPHNAGFAAKLEHWQKRVDHYQKILNG